MPGSSLNPSVSVFFDTVDSIVLGGQIPSSIDTVSLLGSSISALSFTFPPNGVSTFTLSVPAILNGPIQGQSNFPNFTNFNLNMPQTGHLVLTFNFFPASNGVPANYEFSQGNFVATTVPEPGMFGLMATGLAGVLALALRKRRF
jgi:PEP-CTERM motif